MDKRLEAITVRNDQPVFEASNDTDWLNFMPLARTVAGIAIGTDGPFNIGITAKWGSGKTSMLQMVKSLIEQEGIAHANTDNGKWAATHVNVWFNAWQFEREPEPIVPLLMTVHEAMAASEEQHKSFWKEVGDKSLLAFRKVGRCALAVASGLKVNAKAGTESWLKTVLGVNVELGAEFDVDKARKAYAELNRPDDGSTLPESCVIKAIQEFNKISRELVDESKGETPDLHPKVIVYIDDLDRCHPDAALKLLDGIKLVLDQPGFIFILALDKTIVEEYLAKRYRDEFNASNWAEVGQRYIDKLVQLEIPLPPASGRFAGHANGTDAQGYIERMAKDILGEWYDERIAKSLCLCENLSPRDVVRLLLRVRIDMTLWTGMTRPKLRKRTKASREEFVKLEKEEDQEELSLLDVAFSAMLMRLIEYAFDAPHKGDFVELVLSQPMCDLVSEELSGARKNVGGLRKVESKRTDLQESVLSSLKRVRGLMDAIKTYGQFWLNHAELRGMLLRFLDPTNTLRTVDQGSLEIIERAIRQQLGLREDEPWEDRRKEISELILSGTQVSDLSPLSGLTALAGLSLFGTQVLDLSPLSGLATLTGLDLGGTQVWDLSPLSGLAALQLLDLRGTQVSTLFPLSGLRALKWLFLNRTQVSVVSDLAGLKSLKYVNLRETKVSKEDVLKLKEALPNCEVKSDYDEEPTA